MAIGIGLMLVNTAIACFNIYNELFYLLPLNVFAFGCGAYCVAVDS